MLAASKFDQIASKESTIKFLIKRLSFSFETWQKEFVEKNRNKSRA
jgi:hypothetical protein